MLRPNFPKRFSPNVSLQNTSSKTNSRYLERLLKVVSSKRYLPKTCSPKCAPQIFTLPLVKVGPPFASPKICLPELVSPPYTKNGFSLLFIGPGNASLTTYVSSNHGNCPRLLATPPPLSASGSSPPSPAPSTSSTRGRTSTPRRSDLSLPPPSVVEFHPAVGIVAIITVMISYT